MTPSSAFGTLAAAIVLATGVSGQDWVKNGDKLYLFGNNVGPMDWWQADQ